MKKILFAVFALAALASCTNNEVIELNQQAIAFGDVFVDNATRVDYSQTNKPVGAFKVYGTANGVLIYNGNEVTRPTMDGYQDVAWICTGETQYWVPNATYNFMAIVDGGVSNATAMPTTIDFTVADGVNNKDLLLATASVVVDEEGDKTGDLSTNGFVAFTFNHLLSKVSFTVTDNMGANYEVVPTAINVTGAQKNGLYTIGAAKPWAPVGEEKVESLDFSNGPLQILPVTQTLGVEIVYQIYFVKGSTKTLVSTATKTGTIPSREYMANTAYNINVKIGATAIEFTVTTVNGFGVPVNPDKDPSITIQ